MIIGLLACMQCVHMDLYMLTLFSQTRSLCSNVAADALFLFSIVICTYCMPTMVNCAIFAFVIFGIQSSKTCS